MTISPDTHGSGLVHGSLSALRYDGHNDDPNEVAGMIRMMMPSHARVLDVGCGTASVTAIANRGKQNDVLCIEPDASRADVARSRGFNVTCGFLERAFFEKHGRFDVVMFSDVLEHLAAPETMISLAREGLNEKGLMIISVPNVAHWSVRLMLLFGRFDYSEVGLCDATHLRWFTKKTIGSLVATSGFRISDIRYTAGVSLPVYRSKIFRLVPGKITRVLVRSLKGIFPGLFACQFVIKAEVGGG